MPYMTRIPSDLAAFGLRVELTPGWETRGSSSFAPGGVTCHWTAGPRGTTGRPSLNICINGRAGLPGPLCNIYLARDGTCVVVAAGRANHAGVGGFRGLVGNSAVYGIEAESGGDGDWTADQLRVYPILVAALLYGLGRDASWAHGHHEWAPPRKIDIRDIMPSVRAKVAEVLAAGPAGINAEENEMNKEQVAALDQARNHAINAENNSAEARRMLGVMLGWQAPATENERKALDRIYGEGKAPDVDEAALVAGLATMLGSRLESLSDKDIQRIAVAIEDERSRRQDPR